MAVTTNNAICTDSLKLLGDFWTMMIIDKLSDGPLRFRDLEKQIDQVNTATLSNRLKSMTTEGLVSRHKVSRADVTYTLTDLGRQAVPILQAVNSFSEYANKLHD